jgi:hypothetical protein
MWNLRCLLSLLLVVSSSSLTIVACLTVASSKLARNVHHRERSCRSRLYSLSSSEEQNEAEKLRQQAEKLRKEIELFEQKKIAAEQEERKKLQAERATKAATRERYSAVVPILKPNGETVQERCDFTPKYKDGTSYVTTCESNLPLGILLGEGQDSFSGTVIVDEVAVGSNGEMGGILQGDIVRAFTACKMEMELPTWQLIAGGIGVPKTKRFMYSVDGRPFEEVMDAISSNRMDPEQRPVVVVIERCEGP